MVLILSPGLSQASEVTGVLQSNTTAATEGTLVGTVTSGSNNSSSGGGGGSSRSRNDEQSGSGTVLGASTILAQANTPGFPNAGTPYLTNSAMVLTILGLSILTLVFSYRRYYTKRS